MKLSLVTTLYHSARYIDEFHQHATAAARKVAGDAYEILLVNDGSPDDSLAVAVRLAEKDNHVAVIDLSRNFGHHKAILAGLGHASGEKIFLIDSDLEEDPEWLIRFSKQMEQVDCDVVFGVQESRKGDWFERFSGALFYALFQTLADVPSLKNQVTARLMTRRYVEALLLHQEREVSIGGLFLLTGFDQRPQSVPKRALHHTSYTLRKKITLAVDSITSFSNKPLIGIFYTGVIIVLFAGAYLVYLIVLRLVRTTPLIGWTSVIASIWLIGGLIILFVGIVGIYLAKVFSETKQRPNSIVRRIYRNPSVKSGGGSA